MTYSYTNSINKKLTLFKHKNNCMYLRKIITFTFLLLAINIFIPCMGQTQKIMSFNIRYENPNDGVNIWNNRKKELCDLINHSHPHIVGIQEALINQVVYLKQNLKGYNMIGVGRDDGIDKGEFSSIFHDTTIFELLDDKTFWLSQTYDTISVGWDASMERICTYGIFQNKMTRNKIFVFNTHFDHIGKKARTESAKLIIRIINSITSDNDKVILLGDFNCNPESSPIKFITQYLDDGATLCKSGLSGPTGTFNGFDSSKANNNRIDYIFVKNFEVVSYKHIDDRMKNGNFLSDHLPVLIEVLPIVPQ